MPLAPVMVFVHEDKRPFIATFPQNAMQSIEDEDEAEVAFDSIPGRVFKARVKRMFPAIAQGQLAPSGNLIDFSVPWKSGRVAYVIEVEDDLSEYKLARWQRRPDCNLHASLACSCRFFAKFYCA